MTNFDKDGFKFNLETQRFIRNRWETEIGRKVRAEVIECLREGYGVRPTLDNYVLDHPDNYDPYAHPIYPISEMKEEVFWVLTQDDLRGIRFYNEDFENTNGFPKTALSYARFYNCNLKSANLEMSDFSFAVFEKCDLSGAVFAMSGGFNATFRNCVMASVCFFDCKLIDCDLSDTDLTGAYFENAFLKNILVNYKTAFDNTLEGTWNERVLPESQLPDLLRSIRIAYEKAEIWDSMDEFLVAELRAKRRALLWPDLQREKNFKTLKSWIGSLTRDYYAEYSTNPLRVIAISIAIPFVFTLLYWIVGVPSDCEIPSEAFYEALYYSYTTFTTLGFGDVTYGPGRPFLRLLSTLEAFLGAVSMSLLVVVLARKIIR